MIVGLLPQVTRDRNIVLGGPDGVVEVARGDLGAKPQLEGVGQRPICCTSGKQEMEPRSETRQDLPVGRSSRAPVGLGQHGGRTPDLMHGQRLQWHREQVSRRPLSLLVRSTSDAS